MRWLKTTNSLRKRKACSLFFKNKFTFIHIPIFADVAEGHRHKRKYSESEREVHALGGKSKSGAISPHSGQWPVLF